jgi:hypothetical protein
MKKVGIFYILPFVMWYIEWPFGKFVAIRYISPRFGILCQEKSGNPARKQKKKLFTF